jgi:hypothetical protein
MSSDNSIDGVSCHSASLCVAVGAASKVMTSAGPAAASVIASRNLTDRARTTVDVAPGTVGGRLLREDDAASRGAGGDVVTLSNPTVAWTVAHVDTRKAQDARGRRPQHPQELRLGPWIRSGMVI